MWQITKFCDTILLKNIIKNFYYWCKVLVDPRSSKHDWERYGWISISNHSPGKIEYVSLNISAWRLPPELAFLYLSCKKTNNIMLYQLTLRMKLFFWTITEFSFISLLSLSINCLSRFCISICLTPIAKLNIWQGTLVKIGSTSLSQIHSVEELNPIIVEITIPHERCDEYWWYVWK